MKTDTFLTEKEIPLLSEPLEFEPSSNVVSFDCAILAQTQVSIRIAYQGSIYDVFKTDVVDISNPKGGVVTSGGAGAPARLTLSNTAELQSTKRVRAAGLVANRPFVLARHSDISGNFFSRTLSGHEESWLRERGILTGLNIHPLAYTDSTSPSTSQPHLDNWITDDSQNDGGPEPTPTPTPTPDPNGN